ncbi:hypothetical protein L3Q82_008341 [Scortum barcoo]|uniref:Uncharacterized protein n=1 Tax=Scortum barcoo TaxID=214431 RepID=A0ACB8WHJ4_9TELE|nr:hypothetical protein L3Q82_008341 [Scortum barcoo]
MVLRLGTPLFYWGTSTLTWANCNDSDTWRGVIGKNGLPDLLLRAVRSLYDDVVLMASSSQDLQHVLERFAAECEAAGMRISTSKSVRPWFSNRKSVACPLRVGGEILPQVEEFKYLGVLFTSEGKMEA